MRMLGARLRNDRGVGGHGCCHRPRARRRLTRNERTRDNHLWRRDHLPGWEADSWNWGERFGYCDCDDCQDPTAGLSWWYATSADDPLWGRAL